jgi:SAM-dependent methyltransferase
VDRIIAASPGRANSGPYCLDVGCGTGISARLFQAAGCRVLGVDPDPRMAELARQGGTETEVAKFEDWDPADRTFDAVIAAQAWHWVDPVAGAAKAAAVLRPGEGGRRDTAGGAVRRAGGMAVLLGAALHPRRVAGPGPDHRRRHPAPRASNGCR